MKNVYRAKTIFYFIVGVLHVVFADLLPMRVLAYVIALGCFGLVVMYWKRAWLS